MATRCIRLMHQVDTTRHTSSRDPLYLRARTRQDPTTDPEAAPRPFRSPYLAHSDQIFGRLLRSKSLGSGLLIETMTSRIVLSSPAQNNFASEGAATSAATRASRTGSLNRMDPSAASGNGNQLRRIFETSSGIGVTGELREERRYFASGKSLRG